MSIEKFFEEQKGITLDAAAKFGAKYMDMDWKDVEKVQPNIGDEIIGMTNVGQMKGSYISGDIFRTRSGLYSFTKWKFKNK